jgi:hypothetical protein
MQHQYRIRVRISFVYVVHAQPRDLDVVRFEMIAGKAGEPFLWRADVLHIDNSIVNCEDSNLVGHPSR